MMRRYGQIIVLFVLLSIPMATRADDAAAVFSPTDYYLLSLGQVATDLDSLRQSAQSSGFSVLHYAGDSVHVCRPGDPDATEASVLADERLLLLDSGRFLLRDAADGFVFTVRPCELGYELVIDPQRELPVPETLGALFQALQALNVVGSDVSLDISAYAKDAVKGPPPPAGVAIESTLYSLVVARDWHDFARTMGLVLIGLRVEVVSELLPGEALAEAFLPYLVEEAAGAAKLHLPVDLLLSLARSAGVSYVRVPYRPSIP
jgi:hypothetical protein